MIGKTEPNKNKETNMIRINISANLLFFNLVKSTFVVSGI